MPRSLAELLPLITAVDYAVRGAALNELRELDPERAADDLLAAIAAPVTHEQALAALVEVANAHAFHLSFVKKGVAESPDRLAVVLGTRALPVLIDILHREPLLRYQAVGPLAILCSHSPEAFSAVEALKSDPDAIVRGATAVALQYFGDRAVPALEHLMNDRNEADQDAMYALTKIGTPAALKALKKYVRNSKAGDTRRFAKERATWLEAELKKK